MELAIDQAAIEEQIVQRTAATIADRYLSEIDWTDRIGLAAEAIIKQHCDDIVGPIMERGVSEFVLQRTNTFGEKKGEDVTFAEYLTDTANTYLNEEVDSSGKTVERTSWSSKASQTRLCHMLHEYLKHRIAKEMKDAVQIVLEQVAPAIATVCEMKVKEATADIRRAMGHK